MLEVRRSLIPRLAEPLSECSEFMLLAHPTIERASLDHRFPTFLMLRHFSTVPRVVVTRATS